MAIEHVHEEHEPVPAGRTAWFPGLVQFVCLVAGILYVVLGAVGTARAGLDDVTGDEVTVGAFTMTALLALIILAMGVIMLGGAVDRMTGRGVATVFGPALIALGIIALIQPVRALAWNDATGVLFLVTGAVLLVAGMLTAPWFVRSVRTID